MTQILLNNTRTWCQLFQIVRRSKNQGLWFFNGPTLIKHCVNKGQVFRGGRRRSSRSTYYRWLQRSLEEISRSGWSVRDGSKRIGGASESGCKNPNITFKPAREGIFPQSTSFILCSIYSSADLVSINVPTTTANVMKKNASCKNFFEIRFSETLCFAITTVSTSFDRIDRRKTNNYIEFLLHSTCALILQFFICMMVWMSTMYKLYVYLCVSRCLCVSEAFSLT